MSEVTTRFRRPPPVSPTWGDVPPITEGWVSSGCVCLTMSGKRCFWVAVRWPENYPDRLSEVDVAHGWADTPMAAMGAGRAALEDPDAPRGSANLAQSRLREVNAERKAARPAPKHATAARIEFAYRYMPPYEASDGGWIAHRIVGRTNRFVIVNRESWAEEQWLTEAWQERNAELAEQYAHLRTYRLDRAALERGDMVHGETRTTAFFTSGFVLDLSTYGQQHGGWRRELPECLLRLGFTSPNVSRQQIVAAYRRLSKLYHPDAGGNHDQFITLQRAYETALRGLTLRAQKEA